MNVYIGGAKDYSAVRGPCADGFHIAHGTEGVKIKDILTVLLGTTPVGTDLNTYLLLPNAGYIGYVTGAILDVGVVCRFWARNWYELSSSITYINGLCIGSNGQSQIMTNTYNRRGTGYPIRPIKDVKVVPDNSWTTLLDGSGIATGAGVFHNLTLGLISLSSDGEDWITIADKNLGATSTDVTSSNSYGNYYQWGNNYGFTSGYTISSTRVDASTYGPGNYYNSSTFIKTSNNEDWSTVRNDNLWGGVTGIVSPAELKNAYIGEYVDYLCFTANTASSTVQLTQTGTPTAVTLETSTDGNNWSTYTIGNTITLSNVGDKVYWRNTSTTDTGFSTSTSDYYQFVMTGSINGSGDIRSLLNKNISDNLSNYCFYRLFRDCTSLVSAPNLLATTMFNCCYCFMFYNTGIKIVPELPATILATECYNRMFANCQNLETLPKLSATVLENSCYLYMFQSSGKIKISTNKTGSYQTAYRIPTTGTGTAGTNSLLYMFNGTGGTFNGTPSVNTTYYTSNIVV